MATAVSLVFLIRAVSLDRDHDLQHLRIKLLLLVLGKTRHCLPPTSTYNQNPIVLQSMAGLHNHKFAFPVKYKPRQPTPRPRRLVEACQIYNFFKTSLVRSYILG